MKSIAVYVALFLTAAGLCEAWAPPRGVQSSARIGVTQQPQQVTNTAASKIFSTTENTESSSSAEETTEKYGLEVGLFESVKSGDGESAKSLLKKYGIAYLATSIPLAIISFVICYLLVDNGVDVGALLSKVGIESTAGEKAGTFAIAYAAHKAASPIRFPPTVFLTPIVANLIGKEPEPVEEEG